MAAEKSKTNIDTFAENFQKNMSGVYQVFHFGGAGGSHDLHGRAVASVIHTYLGQPMVVHGMPAEGGKEGLQTFKRAKPDGYTLVLASPSHITIGPHVEDVGYDPLNDFIPIFQINYASYMLVARGDKPWKNLDEFVEAARKNPGKMSFGSSGSYRTGHLMILKLMADLDLNIDAVPFKGGSPSIAAMLEGRVDSAGGNPSSDGLAELIRSGEIRALAIAAEERSPLFPDMPTFKEKGIDFILESWRTFLVPKGTPQERIDILVEALEKVSGDKSFKTLLACMGEQPIPLSGEALVKRIRAQHEAFGAIFKSAGLQKTR